MAEEWVEKAAEMTMLLDQVKASARKFGDNMTFGPTLRGLARTIEAWSSATAATARTFQKELETTASSRKVSP
jgi:hypothetical protein